MATPNLSGKIVRINDRHSEPGGFADVHKCHYYSGDRTKEVAVKVFRFKFSVSRQRDEKGKIAQTIRRETGIWKRVKHPNIVPFLGITDGFGREGNASLVSLWMPNGTLHAFLEDYDGHLTDAHRLQLLLDISNGLFYLHSFSNPMPIVHGDLSCNNVLLDGDYTARLVDFGFASAVGDMPEALAYLKSITTGPGAVRWAAPEHFAVVQIECTTKSDIYSLGNLMFYVLSGKFPWSEVRRETVVMFLLSQGRKPVRPTSRPIRDEHWVLIEQCWASIDDRPLARDIVSSLVGFLQSFPTPQPLQKFLVGIQPVSNEASPSPTTAFSSLVEGDGMLGDADRWIQRELDGAHLSTAPPSPLVAPVVVPHENVSNCERKSTDRCNEVSSSMDSDADDHAQISTPGGDSLTSITFAESPSLPPNKTGTVVSTLVSENLEQQKGCSHPGLGLPSAAATPIHLSGSESRPNVLDNDDWFSIDTTAFSSWQSQRAPGGIFPSSGKASTSLGDESNTPSSSDYKIRREPAGAQPHYTSPSSSVVLVIPPHNNISQCELELMEVNPNVIGGAITHTQTYTRNTALSLPTRPAEDHPLANETATTVSIPVSESSVERICHPDCVQSCLATTMAFVPLHNSESLLSVPANGHLLLADAIASSLLLPLREDDVAMRYAPWKERAEQHKKRKIGLASSSRDPGSPIRSPLSRLPLKNHDRQENGDNSVLSASLTLKNARSLGAPRASHFFRRSQSFPLLPSSSAQIKSVSIQPQTIRSAFSSSLKDRDVSGISQLRLRPPENHDHRREGDRSKEDPSTPPPTVEKHHSPVSSRYPVSFPASPPSPQNPSPSLPSSHSSFADSSRHRMPSTNFVEDWVVVDSTAAGLSCATHTMQIQQNVSPQQHKSLDRVDSKSLLSAPASVFQ